MEVPAKLRSALVGNRFWLFTLLLLAATTFLVSCSGGETTVIIVNEDIGSIVLTIDNDSLVAGGFTTTTVTAEVYKFNGEPVPDGTTVEFTITPIGTIEANKITKNGVATVLLTSDAASGEYYITATAGNVGQIAFGEFIPGPADDNNTSLSSNPNSIPADGTSTAQITLTAQDANGNPVVDGTTVNFYTTQGTLSAAAGFTANGVAEVLLTSTEGDGVIATVTATVDGLTKEISVGMGAAIGNGTGTASYIELTISEFSIRVKDSGGNESSVITAMALDETGAPIADFPDNMRFSIESGPNGGEELDSSLLPVTKSTTNGAASVTLTSGTVSGTVQIKVEVILDGTGGGTDAPFATALTTPIGIEAGEPANIIIFQDSLVTANQDGTTSRTVSALAQDQHGNPVENGTVIFFGLVDNPDLAGPPYLGYISAGTNGMTNGTTSFNSAGNTFMTDGLMDDDLLVILEGEDEGGHRIKEVNSNFSLTLYNSMNSIESGLDFVAGYAELGSVCGSVQTGNLEMDSSCTPTTVGGAGSIKGVAHTKLTWVPQGIFKPFYLYAESVGGDVGDTLAGSYPGVTNLSVNVSIIPDTVLSGTSGIFVEAEFKDGSDNPIQGETVTFSSNNPLLANFGGAPVITDETNSVGKATTFELATQTCLDAQQTVKITAAIQSYTGDASLTILPTTPSAGFTCTDAGDNNSADCSDSSTTVSGTTITAWSWDVACNGTVQSTVAEPTLTLGAGTTEICLTVTNDLGCTSSTAQSVTIGAGAPNAAFSFIDNGDGTANFGDTSTAAPGTINNAWAWVFPAGTAPASSALQSPTNIDFGAVGSGPHSVTLTVTNNFGQSDPVTQPVTVSATPAASFTFVDNGDGTADLTDTSTTPGSTSLTGWLWTLPDASTSTMQNLTGVDFATMPNNGTPGEFDVQLQVTNNFGTSDTTTQTVSLAAAPSASFIFTDNTDGTADFDATGSSTPGNTSITNYLWTWPDATTLSTATPTLTNVDFSGMPNNGTGGQFDVDLQVTNNFGDTASTGVTVVTLTAPAPGAAFSFADNADCTVTFNNSTAPTQSTLTQLDWTFTGGAPPNATDSTVPFSAQTVDYEATCATDPCALGAQSLQVTDNFDNISFVASGAILVTGCSP